MSALDGVVVLGAGLSGLGCARELPGCRVFEAEAHSGGHAYSHPMHGVGFDEGAHICHSKDADFLALVRASAGPLVEIEPSVVRNVWNGRWVTYPVQNHLHELPVRERTRALTDLVSAHVERPGGEPADYDQWCRAQYGDYLTEQFYARYTAKYWRVPMAELGTDWLGGRLIPSQLARIIAGAFEAQPERQATFARFLYPARGGFFRLFERLYDTVPVCHGERAVEIDARLRVVSFASGRRAHYEQLASSIPLPVLVSFVKDAPAGVRQAAARLRHTQLLCVNVLVSRPALTDCHWFYAYDEGIDAARVSVPSNLAPDSVPPGTTALQAEVFRRDDEPLDAAALVERVVRQLGEVLHFNPVTEVLAAGHVYVPRAYVISDHHRAKAVAEVCEWLQGQDVYTMGLHGRWKYLWSDQAFQQGRQTAAEILRRRACA